MKWINRLDRGMAIALMAISVVTIIGFIVAGIILKYLG